MRVKVLSGPIPVGLLYHRAGEQVDMPDAIAKVLIKVGRVAAVGAEEQRGRRVYRRTDATPEQTAVMVAERVEHAPRRARAAKAPKAE